MSDELNEQMKNISVYEGNFTRSDDEGGSSIGGGVNDAKKSVIEDRIILNVGGIKYETFRSTLTAYPDTLLGIMFSERNKEMLHPTNVNEYFFDRDGYIFRYILQYYRTGQVHWPEFSSPYQVTNSSIDLVQGTTKTFTTTSSSSNNVDGGRIDNLTGFGGTSCPTLPFTRAELEQELLFFLIPTKSDEDLIESLLHEETSSVSSTQPLTFANKAVVDNVNGFLYALKEVMYCVASLFEKKIMITFYHDRQQPIFKLIPPNPNIIMNELAPFNEKIKNILIPYAGVGYTLLMNFENEIEAWMKEEIKELKWAMEKPGGNTLGNGSTTNFSS
ncbi:1794_t:CDS:2 [Funneliformis geosporum]|nr:1794_t:CDS:2 [Funneliformis geosporum]